VNKIEDLVGHFIRGVLYDGVYIYLVEANKRVYQLCVTSTRFSDDFIECIGHVKNAEALSEATIESLKMGEVFALQPGEINAQTFTFETSRGVCELEIHFSAYEYVPDIIVRNYVGEPPKNIRRLTDF
jgi:hypothetical protein